MSTHSISSQYIMTKLTASLVIELKLNTSIRRTSIVFCYKREDLPSYHHVIPSSEDHRTDDNSLNFDSLQSIFRKGYMQRACPSPPTPPRSTRQHTPSLTRARPGQLLKAKTWKRPFPVFDASFFWLACCRQLEERTLGM